MKVSFVRLSTKDLATLAERTISSSKKEVYAMAANHPVLLKLVATFAVYDSVYTKKTYSGLGKDVAEADKLQDMPFKGMKDVLHGFMRVEGLSNTQAAADLYHIFESYGLDLCDYSYSSETAQMKKLLEELDLPGNQEKLSQVRLIEMYGMLKANHFAFLQMYSEQSESNAALRQQQSASSVRGNLEADLRNYFNLVEVMSSIDNSWTPLFAELSGFLKAAINSKTTAKATTTEKVN